MGEQKHTGSYYDAFAKEPGRHVGLEGVVNARGVGYTAVVMASVPEGSDRGLSSGNPFAGIEIVPGSTVVDLGCGAGRDCFIAAAMVGQQGRVVGIDASEAMVDEAHAIAVREGFTNVEFLVGEALSVPLDDDCADYVISNCVFNQVDDKVAAFREMQRILRESGTLSFSDVMKTPEASSKLARSKTACLARAVLVDAYLDALMKAGFGDVRVDSLRPWPTYRGVVSAHIVARV